MMQAPRPNRSPGSFRSAYWLLMIGFAFGSLFVACGSSLTFRSVRSALDRPPLEVFGHRFERRRLANGLEAIAVREPNAGAASIYVIYGVGTRHETADVSGIAHLTEHLLFSGTATTGLGEHEAFVASAGGESNAFTRADYTFYYNDAIPLDVIPRVLAMEADRMRGLTFEPASVEFERERLIAEEKRSSTDRRRREQEVDRAVFGSSNYGSQLTDADGHTRAKDLELDVVRAFYERWYVPENAAVVIAGDLDEKAALEAIERAFAAVSPGDHRDSMPPGDPPRATTRRIEANLDAPMKVRAWRGPARRNADGDPSDRLALSVLARVTSARRGGVIAEVGDRAAADRFSLYATGPEADQQIRRTLEELRTVLVPREKLLDATAALEREWRSAPLRGRPYFSLAGQIGILTVLGDPEYLVDALSALDRLTPARVRETAAKWLTPESSTVIHFDPRVGETMLREGALPSDPEALAVYAERAVDSGRLPAAAQAYRRISESVEDLRVRVIALYSLAQIERQRGRLRDARTALLDALALVEYPAVRALLQEVESEIGAGPSVTAPPTTTIHGAARPAYRSAFGVANPAELPPEIVARAEDWMARVEQWRGLPFLEDLRIEYGVEGEDEHLAGYYSPAEGRLVVMAGRNETFSNGTLLHEIVHALQDQHFDLAQLHRDADTADAQRALAALIEGEAMLAVSELMNYDFLSHAALFRSQPIDRDRFYKVFRYAEGMRLVMALRESGDWALVDDAWRSPPDRTIEVLRPDLWISGTRDEKSTATALGAYAVCLLLGDDERSRPHARTLAMSVVADRFTRAGDAPTSDEPDRWTIEFESTGAAKQFRALVADRRDVHLVSSDAGGTSVSLDLDGSWAP